MIGVVEDFHFESMRTKIEPLSMVLGNSPELISVKAASNDLPAVIEAVSKTWKQFAPHQPFRYSFLDQRFAQMYDDVKRMGTIFTCFALFAIIVACLGLFGLSSFMIEQRGKEISIRLVLGASVNNIFRLLTRNFVALIILSFIVASPLAWYLMRQWLQDYSYQTPITWDIFAIAGATCLVIALLTVSVQALKAAVANPVDRLKAE